MPHKNKPRQAEHTSSIAVANDRKSSGISHSAAPPLQRAPVDKQRQDDASYLRNNKVNITDIGPFQLKPGYAGSPGKLKPCIKSQPGAGVVQRVLLYKGKRFTTPRGIADDQAAWTAFSASKD